MIELEPTVRELVERGALFVVNHSGGKDSQAMTIALQSVIPTDQLVLIHADAAPDGETSMGLREALRLVWPQERLRLVVERGGRAPRLRHGRRRNPRASPAAWHHGRKLCQGKPVARAGAALAASPLV